MPYVLLLVLFMLIMSLWLLRQGNRAQESSGLPEGEVIYSDAAAWQRVDKPLISHRYGLVGKPDYLLNIKEGRKQITIPVEVKSRNRPHQPHAGHILQLGVYCLLVEEHHGSTPSHGLLRYADATLRIPFNNALRRDVLTAAAAIRAAEQARDVRRSHDAVARCRACGYRHGCGNAALV